MYLSTKSFLSPHFAVIDIVSNKRISLVQWVDDKKQIGEKLIRNNDGSLKMHYDKINEEEVADKETIRGGFKLVGKNPFTRTLKKAIDIFITK